MHWSQRFYHAWGLTSGTVFLLSISQLATATPRPIEVSFELPQIAPTAPPAPQAPMSLFVGGSHSLIARVIGHAEGTRTRTGAKTWAYYGHRDPGNGRWNLGSFSYQHCQPRCSPEEADRRQLQRLQQQTRLLTAQADRAQLHLTLEETLNGIDLANQAPLAALAPGGYLDRLQAARNQGLTGSAAVLWARTYAYQNPDTGRWEAPGLGNTYPGISFDQARRQAAIAAVLAYELSRKHR